MRAKAGEVAFSSGETCPACGYSMRGLGRVPRCPECGGLVTPIRLARLADAHRGWVNRLREGAARAWYGSICELLLAGLAAACGAWLLGLQLGQVAVAVTLAWSACGLVTVLGFGRLTEPEPGGPDTLASREDVRAFVGVLGVLLGSVAAICLLGLLVRLSIQLPHLLVVLGLVHLAHAILISAIAFAAARYGRDLAERVPDEASTRCFEQGLIVGMAAVLLTVFPAVWLALTRGPGPLALLLLSGPWIWRLFVVGRIRAMLLGVLPA